MAQIATSDTESQVEKYLANAKLRNAGQKLSMTKKQVVEFMRCKDDPIYMIERYVKIVNPDKGLIPIQLYPEQKEMVQLCHDNRKVIIKAARQVGKTTTVAVGYLLHYILFNSDKTVGILANKEATAIEILARLKIAYMNLPLWLQQGVVEWNKSSIKIENGSRVLAGSTSSDAIRGWTLTLLYLDEFAFVPPHVANDFFASVYPTISSGETTKIIVTSTPNGLNLFYKLCTDALNKRNGFAIREYDWRIVPWRTEAWAEDQKRTVGEDKFEQEHMCEFLGSAGTLISGKVLRTMAYREPSQLLYANTYYEYEKPIANTTYMLVADSSHGKEIDASAFLVIDISKTPYRIVAKYADNAIPPELYPSVIVATARHYNDAYVMAENNDIGAMVLNIIINDLEYENVIYTDDVKKEQHITNQMGKTAGIRTTKKTKRQGCLAMKTLIERGEFIVDDFQTIEELSTFVKHKNNTYAADADKHDDLVMPIVIFAWCTTQTFFKDLTDQDMRLKMMREETEKLNEMLPPMPIAPNDPSLPKNHYKDGGVIWELVGASDEHSDTDPDHAWHGRYTGY